MKVPVRWLKELVAVDWSADEIAQRLTMAGLEAEGIERIGSGWDHVYVGTVIRVTPHPNADRLRLVDVRAGEHGMTVVTGAPNIAAGQKVPLALAGARLFDGHSDEPKLVTLKPSTIRGVRSEAMVCSEKELGLSEEHEGIMVLDPSAPEGAPLRDYLGQEVIEFEITPNLVHDFSLVGIARELGALASAPVRYPPLASLEAAPRDERLVTVEDSTLCPRYVGVVIDGVRVEGSPDWMQRRLLAAGVRPINNIVDVTNYVMLELGQPLHAFDRARLAEGRIVVRRARAGERIETLDHLERQLEPETLVIADAERAVAIAGVMGGVDSEINSDTTTILLESANFNRLSVRRTAREQRLRTDASSRFERGIDPTLAGSGAARAVALIRQLSPGARLVSMADVYPNPVKPRPLTMPRAEIGRLLGVDFSDEEVLGILSRLDFMPRLEESNGERRITVQVPTWRSDISLSADLVEEVARIAGYDNLPETLPVGRTVPLRVDPMRRLLDATQDLMVAAGLNEVLTYSMTNEADLRALAVDGEIGGRFGAHRAEWPLVEAVNPLRAEWQVMRPTLLVSLLRNVAENRKFSASIGIFEAARVYLPRGLDDLPDEVPTLALALAGRGQHETLYSPAREVDFFDAKGIVEEYLRRVGAGHLSFRPSPHPSLHPGRSASIVVGEREIGILGEVHPIVAERFGLSGRVVAAEINLAMLLSTGLLPVQFSPVSRFMPVEQDFAVVVAEETPAGAVVQALRAGAGALLRSVRLFDIYRGPAIPPGTKSMAVRVTLEAPDRALDEREVERVRGRIEGQLKRRVGGTLRG